MRNFDWLGELGMAGGFEGQLELGRDMGVVLFRRCTCQRHNHGKCASVVELVARCQQGSSRRASNPVHASQLFGSFAGPVLPLETVTVRAIVVCSPFFGISNRMPARTIVANYRKE